MPHRTPDDLLPLTTAMFHVLVCLAEGDRHGYRIMKDVAARTGGRVRLSTGTLYGIIKRLLDDGLVIEIDREPARRREYRLTAFGRQVAQAEARRLEDLVTAARSTRLLPGRRRS